MSSRTDGLRLSRHIFNLDYSAVWLVALIGLALSLAALWLIREQLEAHRLLDFEWVAHNRTRALNHGIDSGLSAMESVRDLFAATETVDAASFQVFAGSLLTRYQGINALMWVPLRHRQSPAGEQPPEVGDRKGFADILGTGAGYSFPVTYSVPAGVDRFPLGLDLGRIPEFASLLRQAHGTGKIAASGRIGFLSRETTQSFGFMAVLPVYSGSASEIGAATENRVLRGFVIGLFRLSDLVRTSISLLEPRGVEILILDESAEQEHQFLHFYASRLAPRRIDVSNYRSWWAEEDELKITEQIEVADRNWLVVSGRTEQFLSAEAFQQGPWVVLVAGLLFTLLLSFYLERIRENARQRLEMEQQLVEREALFRQMMETVDEAFWAASADGGKLLYLSPAYERITGTIRENPNDSLSNAIGPQETDALDAALQRAVAEKADFEIVYTLQRADGTQRWIRTRGFPVVGDQGEVDRLVGFSEDITERKLADEALRESEAQLRDLFQQSPDIIMTVDKRGKILLMNRSVPEFPAERAVGRNSRALMPSDFRKWYTRALAAVFDMNVTREFDYSTDRGTYWAGRILPIHSEGAVTAAMVIASDVTEKRNLETQTLRNARLASIGVLAAGVAHEINNPNNAIQFNAALISRVWDDIRPILSEYYAEHGDFAIGGLVYSEAAETLPRLLGDIGANSERIRRIVLNLKHMARQDQGDYAQSVDIGHMLETAMLILHNQIQKYTDDCSLEIPENLPAVKGNSQQLEQVFINVLLNALQSLPDRKRSVHISAGYHADRQSVDIRVQDEGRGVSERDMGRLTEPFFTTKTEMGGTGLGLSISRSIMERHGGNLMFESTPGVGTTAILRIPCPEPATELHE